MLTAMIFGENEFQKSLLYTFMSWIDIFLYYGSFLIHLL